MKIFFRLFVTISLLFSLSSAIDFADIKKIDLKKDEQTKILVKYKNYEKLFKFRWTLYKNEGLVMFYSYGKRVMQNILYLNGTNQSFKVYLKTKGADFYEVPYFLLKFKEFDAKKHKAKFELFLFDKKSQMKIKYLTKNIK